MSVWITLKMRVQKSKINDLTAFLQVNLANVRGFDGAMQVNLFYNP